MFSLILSIAAVLWATATQAADEPAIATFADTTVWTGVELIDETIPAPSRVLLEPYRGDMIGGTLLRWPAVPGATGYRLWREIIVSVGIDSLGQLIEIEDPYEKWVPWAKVDQAPDGMEVGVIVPNFEPGPVRWGVSTFVLRDGSEYRSLILIVGDIATPTDQLTWGAIKSTGKR